MSAPLTTPASALQLTTAAAVLLFENGQTTERTIDDARRLATALGFGGVDIFLRWGELTVRLNSEAGTQERMVAAAPAGVDMGKVAATLAVIDEVESRRHGRRGDGIRLADNRTTACRF